MGLKYLDLPSNFTTNIFTFTGITGIDSQSFLQKTCFLDMLAVFRLDFGQISFNLFENVLATRKRAVLATSNTFYDILARACAEIKMLRVFGVESDLWP